MAKAFSLIELIVVMGVVGLMLALALQAPISYQKDLNLNLSAEKLCSQLRLAQYRAFSSGRTQSVGKVSFASSGFPLVNSEKSVVIHGAAHKSKRVVISNVGRIRIE